MAAIGGAKQKRVALLFRVRRHFVCARKDHLVFRNSISATSKQKLNKLLFATLLIAAERNNITFTKNILLQKQLYSYCTEKSLQGVTGVLKDRKREICSLQWTLSLTQEKFLYKRCIQKT
ncbi:MAG: hypothetical protein KH354_04730 [Clostridiales bacterium]|nr:hypothetical protein [Clostridiales bacterium]